MRIPEKSQEAVIEELRWQFDKKTKKPQAGCLHIVVRGIGQSSLMITKAMM